MVRMVVTDLDGTLFDYSSHISDENLKAIRRIQDNGLTFAIASGRSYELAFKPLWENGINCEAILGNGSQYVDINGDIIFSCYMKRDAFLGVTDCFDSSPLYYMIYTNDGFYTGQDPETVRDAFITRGQKRFARKREEFDPGGKYYYMPCNHLKKVDDFSAFADREPEIIKVEAFSIDPGPVEPVREKLKDIPGIAYLSSFDDNIEVTDENAQKGLILEKVAAMKGLLRDEVMVLGDGMNDISLFTHFPDNAYAPANADARIRSIATKVVSSNMENGFAEAVNEVLDRQSQI